MMVVMVDVVALAALLVAVLPFVRIVADREFRRCFLQISAAIVAALLVGGAATGVVFALWRGLLVPVAVIATIAAALATWRARPNWGVQRGLPPGSLSLSRSVRALAHRGDALDQANRFGPVYKAAQFSGPVVCVHGLERGQRLVREHRSSIGPSPLAFTQQLMGGFLRYMDDDTHDVYGPLLRRAMSRAVTDEAAPVARAVIRRELSGLDTKSVPPGPVLDGVCYVTLRYALFGIASDSSLAEPFDQAFEEFAERAILHPRDRRTLAALDSLRELVGRQIEHLGSTERPVPCALVELHTLDASMPDPTCIDNLIFMLRIGGSNVSSLMSWMLEMLGTDDDWRRRLSGWSGTCDERQPDLLDAYVMEVLRLAQSEYVYRRLVDDVEFEGFRLKRGWLVRICVWESHRDPAVFEDPATFTDRFWGNRHPQTEYCPFGFDRHACNSVGITSMLARILLEEVVADDTIEIHPAGTVSRDFRHWSHWRPGPGLAVARRVG